MEPYSSGYQSAWLDRWGIQCKRWNAFDYYVGKDNVAVRMANVMNVTVEGREVPINPTAGKSSIENANILNWIGYIPGVALFSGGLRIYDAIVDHPLLGKKFHIFRGITEMCGLGPLWLLVDAIATLFFWIKSLSAQPAQEEYVDEKPPPKRDDRWVIKHGSAALTPEQRTERQREVDTQRWLSAAPRVGSHN